MGYTISYGKLEDYLEDYLLNQHENVAEEVDGRVEWKLTDAQLLRVILEQYAEDYGLSGEQETQLKGSVLGNSQVMSMLYSEKERAEDYILS